MFAAKTFITKVPIQKIISFKFNPSHLAMNDFLEKANFLKKKSSCAESMLKEVKSSKPISSSSSYFLTLKEYWRLLLDTNSTQLWIAGFK